MEMHWFTLSIVSKCYIAQWCSLWDLILIGRSSPILGGGSSMRVNTFKDGTREKNVVFTSNGQRTVSFVVPKDSIIKSARLEMEDLELPDTDIIRIGILKNISLEDYDNLEERLEDIVISKDTVKPGWISGRKPEYEGSRKYRILPLDPNMLISAHPSFFRNEFDLVIIPDGPLRGDLGNLTRSGIPLITLNPGTIKELGIGIEDSLRPSLSTIHVADMSHYITEQVSGEKLNVGGTPGDQSRQVAAQCIVVNEENAKVIVDTGTADQGILVTDLRNKYAYFGFPKISQVLGDPALLALLRRTIEWCGIGGYLVNLGYEVCGESGGWKKPGRLVGIVETPNFGDFINRFMEKTDPGIDGTYTINMTFFSDSPGMLVLSNIRIDCAFRMSITQFSDGAEEVEVDFDSIEEINEIRLNIPSQAQILRTSLRLKGDLSRERVAVHCSNTWDVKGIIASSRYLVSQALTPDINLEVTKMALRLAKVESDTEVTIEISPDHEGQPMQEVIASASLGPSDIPATRGWVDIKFERLNMLRGNTYWIILRTKKGQVEWHTDSNNPVGGKLRYSKDGGRSWHDHNMDALFKVFFQMEIYDPSPSLRLGSRADPTWTYTGEFREEQLVPDFTEELNAFLKTYANFQQKYCTVPLRFSSESIGTITLQDLKIECELPTLEMKEELQEVTIESQLLSIFEIMRMLNMKLERLVETLPEDMVQGLKIPKKGEEAPVLRIGV